MIELKVKFDKDVIYVNDYSIKRTWDTNEYLAEDSIGRHFDFFTDIEDAIAFCLEHEA